ncbi:MAG TPA: DUF2207 domain-containing protein [bacterium]|nr:DUF2207 domain-containing protein [bacterium]
MIKLATWIGLTVTAVFLCMLIPVQAVHAESAEKVTDFHTSIRIIPNENIMVQERITFDFGTNERHGIIREISKVREDVYGKQVRLSFELMVVTDEQGNAYKYRDESDADMFRIRVGEIDRTITGSHTYVFHYIVSNVLDRSSNMYLLSWDINGFGWTVPMEEISAKIRLPAFIDPETVDASCFTGDFGSTERECSIEQADRVISLVTDRALRSGENMTVVVSFETDQPAVQSAQQMNAILVVFFIELLSVLQMLF